MANQWLGIVQNGTHAEFTYPITFTSSIYASMAGNGNGEGNGVTFTGNNYRTDLTTLRISTYIITASSVRYANEIRCVGIIVGW